jgi:hypothetical protein
VEQEEAKESYIVSVIEKIASTSQLIEWILNEHIKAGREGLMIFLLKLQFLWWCLIKF